MTAYRKGYSRGLALVSMSALSVGLIHSPVSAQSTTVPEARSLIDENGVDLSNGKVDLEVVEASIGSANGAVQSSSFKGEDYGEGNKAYVIDNFSTKQVVIGNSRADYDPDGTNRWVAANGDGGVLTRGTQIINGLARTVYTLEGGNGGRIVFSTRSQQAVCGDIYDPCDTVPYNIYLATEIEEPTGVAREMQYGTGSYCQQDEWNTCIIALHVHRLERMETNDGIEVRYIYKSNNRPTANQGNGADDDWPVLDRIQTINLATNTCNPYPAICTGSSVRNTRRINSTTTRNHANQDTVYINNIQGRLIGVRPPGYSTNKLTYGYNSTNRVSQASNFGVTSTYTYNENRPTDEFTTIKTTGGLQEKYVFSLGFLINRPSGQLLRYEGPDGVETTFSYDTSGRLTSSRREDGLEVEAGFDNRGNITVSTITPKTGSSLAPINRSATFDANCTNSLTCNQPKTVKDPLNNVTNFTYNSTHGGLTKAEAPAPGAGQQRPTVTNSYSTLVGKYKNSSGTLVPYSVGQVKLTETRHCLTAASCVGSANERVTTYEYNHPNLMLTKATVATGNGSASQVTTFGYDSRLNLSWEDGPLPGSGDRTYYYYDNLDRRRGKIYPDPDGSGALPRPVERITFDSANRIQRREYGTATAVGTTALNNMVPDRAVEYVYDANGRVLQEKLIASSATVGLTQTTYDNLGRVDCVAQRLDPSKYGSLPASACVQSSTNAAMEDRISKNVYASNGRLSGVKLAVDTDLEQTAISYGYDTVGNVTSITDASGNKTAYQFDGFDRVVRTIYPSKTSPGATNGNDDIDLTYDARSQIKSINTRANETLNLTYDNLGRLTFKNLPVRSGLASTHQRDIYYTYDLAGNMTFARAAGSTSGEGIAYNYNGLGQLTSTTQALDGQSRTISYLYDQAGNRTRITHPDGAYFGYDYDKLGRFTNVRQSNSILGTASYTSLGEMEEIDWHYAAATDHKRTYGYDNAGRLNSIDLDLNGTSKDVTWTYTHDAASQILSESQSNDAYSWDGHINVNRNYTANGLNQYSTAGSANFTYDANGNLTSDGTSSYQYDIENRLVRVIGGGYTTHLYYDPLGRLYRTTTNKPGFGQVNYLHDGNALVAEYASNGTMLNRYVHGTDLIADDPLIWYQGSAVNGSTRRFLHADSRGSIVAVASQAGTSLYANTYDEFGIPGSTNAGRFQYTGQAWLPEIGLYHYKARVYSPTLGRFMQNDPIGYDDGLNMYAYVGNDPVNWLDPTGLNGQLTDCRTVIVDVGPFDGVIYRSIGQRCSGFTGGQSFGRVAFNSIAREVQQAIEEARDLKDAALQGAKELYCSSPTIGGGVSAGGYGGLGGGVTGELVFDPQTGRIGLSGGINVGAGAGGSFAVTANTGRSVDSVPVTASIGVNGNVVVGPLRGGASATLIDRNGLNPKSNGFNGTIKPGGGLSVNVNLTARGGTTAQILPSCK